MTFVPCLNPATVSGLSLPEFLRIARHARFTSVEVPIQQVVMQGMVAVRDLLASHELTVAAASGILPSGPVLPSPLLIEENAYAAALVGLHERLKAFEMIGCPTATIVLNPRTRWHPQVASDIASARLQHLARLAADHGVHVAVEAVGVQTGLDASLDGPVRLACSLPQLDALLQRVDGDVKVCIDSFHWAVTGADPAHITDLGPSRIAHVQIADVPAGILPEQWTDEMRLFPGDGTLPWKVFEEALTLTGYSGPVSVELFNPDLRSLPEPVIAQRSWDAAMRCLVMQR